MPVTPCTPAQLTRKVAVQVHEDVIRVVNQFLTENATFHGGSVFAKIAVEDVYRALATTSNWTEEELNRPNLTNFVPCFQEAGWEVFERGSGSDSRSDEGCWEFRAVIVK